jgi:hypothetical protein
MPGLIKDENDGPEVKERFSKEIFSFFNEYRQYKW